MELKFCKDCARAKHKEGFSRDLWYCGKHRQFITEFTTTEMYLFRKNRKPCPDYECPDYERR